MQINKDKLFIVPPSGEESSYRIGFGKGTSQYMPVEIIDEHSGSILYKISQIIKKYCLCYICSYSETVIPNFNKKYTILVSVPGLSKHLDIKESKIWQAAKEVEGIYNLIKNNTDLVRKKEIESISKVYESTIANKKNVTKNHSEVIEYNNKKYYVEASSEGDKIQSIYYSTFIAQGGQGIVHKLENLTDPEQEPEIMKVGIPQFSFWGAKKPNPEIKMEYDILKEINPNGDLEGIQEPPRKFVSLKDNSTAFITKKYDRDYREDISLFTKSSKKPKSKKERYTELIQLMKGLGYLKVRQVVHVDIKPDNIFIKDNKAVLADFGGAVKANDLTKTKNLIYTCRYIHSKDSSYLTPSKKSNLNDKDYLDKLNAISVFQLGIVMYQSFAGVSDEKYPFNLDYNSYCSGKPKISNKVPEELKKLISEMLDPDFRKRPTIENVLKNFEAISGLVDITA
jgi:serine/threonine protein kinase